MSDIKDRIDKADERTIALFKKYPVVGSLVFLAGFAVGAFLVWVF
jgi:predicted heme/steroid binding protein